MTAALNNDREPSRLHGWGHNKLSVYQCVSVLGGLFLKCFPLYITQYTPWMSFVIHIIVLLYINSTFYILSST